MTDAIRKKNHAQSKSEIILRNATVTLLAVFFITFFIVPFVMALVGSFYQWNPLKNLFKFAGFGNWARVFGDNLFWRSLLNTIVFSFVVVILRLVLGLALATALYTKLAKFKSVYRALYYLPSITPLVAVSFVWKFIYAPQMGLLNQFLGTNINWLYNTRYAFPAIVLLTLWKDYGYAVVILLGALYSLPKDCYDAAAIDGAGAWQRFRLVTVPMLKPTLLFLTITSLITYLQTFVQVMVLTKGGPGTQTYVASYLIYDQAFVKYNFGYASALSFILFLFIAALTALSFKMSGGMDSAG